MFYKNVCFLTSAADVECGLYSCVIIQCRINLQAPFKYNLYSNRYFNRSWECISLQESLCKHHLNTTIIDLFHKYLGMNNELFGIIKFDDKYHVFLLEFFFQF